MRPVVNLLLHCREDKPLRLLCLPHAVHINIAPLSSALAIVVNVSSFWLVSQAAVVARLSASYTTACGWVVLKM